MLILACSLQLTDVVLKLKHTGKVYRHVRNGSCAQPVLPPVRSAAESSWYRISLRMRICPLLPYTINIMNASDILMTFTPLKCLINVQLKPGWLKPLLGIWHSIALWLHIIHHAECTQ